MKYAFIIVLLLIGCQEGGFKSGHQMEDQVCLALGKYVIVTSVNDKAGTATTRNHNGIIITYPITALTYCK